MKLDATVLRTMGRQDFRVLAAVESGMKNRELVPVKIICSLANLRHGGVHKILSTLLRDKLLSHDQSCGYDGYRLTNAGYDILALHTLKTHYKLVGALGQRIGTGKESDVYLAATPEGKQIVLKFHRLGRTSFRDVKSKRDYFNYNAQTKRGYFKEQPQSWLFLSKISALKEYSFMKALHKEGYPTPTPLGHDRHVVAMSLVRGVPLYQVHVNRVSADQAVSIFEQSTSLATRLAQNGLVHCDLNEFNLVVDLSGIQAKNFAEESAAGDPYVRHSGLSVEIKGALSAHGPLQHSQFDATGELITEAPLEPTEFLENGEPKPIVTLIDFPQMVSTRHPNAKELYDRDFECLKRFFTKKLKLSPPEDQTWDDLVPSFEDVISTNAETKPDDDSTTLLASKAQLRIDQELQASGYSVEDSQRQLQFYYHSKLNDSEALQEETNLEAEENEEESENGQNSNSVQSQAEEGDVANYCEPLASPNEGDDYSLSSEEPTEQQNIVLNDQRSVLDYVVAEERARERVQKFLMDQKKKKQQQGAYRSKNSNKTFVKGKRMHKEW